MKKLIICMTLLGLIFLLSGQSLKAQDKAKEAGVATDISKTVDVGNKICPVSGEKIDEKLKATYEYKGKTYNFCCAMCIDAFKKDPEKYIKQIEEEAKSKKDDAKATPEQGEMHHSH